MIFFPLFIQLLEPPLFNNFLKIFGHILAKSDSLGYEIKCHKGHKIKLLLSKKKKNQKAMNVSKYLVLRCS